MIAKIIGLGRLKLLLKDGRIKTLTGVLNIPNLVRNLTFVSKMSDVSVHTIFKIDKLKMVQGEIVLIRGVWCL